MIGTVYVQPIMLKFTGTYNVVCIPFHFTRDNEFTSNILQALHL